MSQSVDRLPFLESVPSRTFTISTSCGGPPDPASGGSATATTALVPLWVPAAPCTTAAVVAFCQRARELRPSPRAEEEDPPPPDEAAPDEAAADEAIQEGDEGDWWIDLTATKHKTSRCTYRFRL